MKTWPFTTTVNCILFHYYSFHVKKNIWNRGSPPPEFLMDLKQQNNKNLRAGYLEMTSTTLLNELSILFVTSFLLSFSLIFTPFAPAAKITFSCRKKVFFHSGRQLTSSGSGNAGDINACLFCKPERAVGDNMKVYLCCIFLSKTA